MTAPPTPTTTQRAYATFTPKWQRFQSPLILSSTQVVVSSGGSSKKGEKKQQQQQQFPYQRQYSHVYHQRLAMLGPRCWERIQEEEEEEKAQQQQQEMNDNNDDDNTTAVVTKVQRILELREDVPSFVVGALVKETSANGSSSSSSNNNNNNNSGTTTMLHPDSHCHASDALYLEDESGRVSLSFSSSSKNLQGSVAAAAAAATSSSSSSSRLHEFPTGVVVGLKGTVGTDGVMQVEAVFPPKLPPPAAVVTSSSSSSSLPPHLLLLSGLHCGAADVSSLPRDMLLSFLQGQFGTTEKAACISHVVIAGGSLFRRRDPSPNDDDGDASKQQQQQPKTKNNNNNNETTAALRDLDAFLLQLTALGIPVTVLPGQDDPTTANWPQRPLHAALLPRSSGSSGSSSSHLSGRKSLLARAPNPYAAAHHEKLVVGTDGTNIRDLTQRMLWKKSRSSSSTTTSTTTKDDAAAAAASHDDDLEPISELQALRRTLEWSHICPTGPDSVPTVPHLERDPMVLQEQWPALYFAGNARRFATTKVPHDDDNDNDDSNACRLVCIPEFGSTGQAVLVNMETMNVEILRFVIED